MPAKGIPVLEEIARSIDLGATLPKVPLSSVNPASWAYERLVTYIRTFEADLTEEEELGACLVSHGSGTTFHVSDLGYHGPDFVTFHGVDLDGRRVQLVQHISQISVLLVALPATTGAKPRRIGFKLRLPEEDSD